ncbi:hypothetical protein Cal6303_1030 [Calothrix sp. PCC 6303]|nr:hypothetical protein Cal6303_1030 [Calothrix sp. PCC 6303]
MCVFVEYKIKRDAMYRVSTVIGILRVAYRG